VTASTGPPLGSEAVSAPERIAERNPVWYHTIELGPGVVTPGLVDLRPLASRVLPDDLSGKRALDVGTFDGFWAFELERRGAEVVAIDVETIDAAEWPALRRDTLAARMRERGVEIGRGFRLAAEALGSAAQHTTCDVYDLSADAIGGPVDVAFCGAILLHLRDPVRALERVRDTLAPGGSLIVLEPFSVRETLLAPRRRVARFEPLDTEFNWWEPNLSCLRAWPLAAGFADVRRTGIHRIRAQKPLARWYCGLVARDL
jgi:SAM-dependent methyltransferase